MPLSPHAVGSSVVAPNRNGAAPGAPKTATTRVVTKINRTAVLDAIRASGPMTRRDIQEHTGLSSATVERLCSSLVAEGLIVADGSERSARGRPAVLYRHAGEGRVVAAVEVSASGVRGRLVDLDGRVVYVAPEVPCGDGEAPRGVQATLRVTEDLLEEARTLNKPCLAVGVSVPGAVSTPEGRVRNAVELGWYDLPLGDILRARHELPIVIENDANAVGYGEWSRGAGVGSEHLVAFVLGNGAGAGIVSGGKILRGNRSAAGEIGFLLADRSAFDALYTLQGDLETRIATASGPSVGALLDAAVAGEADAVRAAAEVFDYVGIACAALSAVLDPEVIVLAGQLARQPHYSVKQVRQRLVGRITFPPNLIASQLGDEAALTGVAQIAIDRARESIYLT